MKNWSGLQVNYELTSSERAWKIQQILIHQFFAHLVSFQYEIWFVECGIVIQRSLAYHFFVAKPNPGKNWQRVMNVIVAFVSWYKSSHVQFHGKSSNFQLLFPMLHLLFVSCSALPTSQHWASGYPHRKKIFVASCTRSLTHLYSAASSSVTKCVGGKVATIKPIVFGSWSLNDIREYDGCKANGKTLSNGGIFITLANLMDSSPRQSKIWFCTRKSIPL